MINLHFFCLESGVDQSRSVRYYMVKDKQEVITQRFGNTTVRKDEISLLYQNAASMNCYSSECKDMAISGHTRTQRLLRRYYRLVKNWLRCRSTFSGFFIYFED